MTLTVNARVIERMEIAMEEALDDWVIDACIPVHIMAQAASGAAMLEMIPWLITELDRLEALIKDESGLSDKASWRNQWQGKEILKLYGKEC